MLWSQMLLRGKPSPWEMCGHTHGCSAWVVMDRSQSLGVGWGWGWGALLQLPAESGDFAEVWPACEPCG